MRLKEVISSPWVASLLVTTASLLFALYIYRLSKVERLPVFLVDRVRTEILSSERVSTAPIKVIKNDGSPVERDLTSIRFFFWNMGKQSIRREDVLDSLYVKLGDPNAEIIDKQIREGPIDAVPMSILPEVYLIENARE